ncbi:unnamed protein product [Auanema sp. JU1783]|nr:unnamed protein product [Auanema sp. JU1783]
MKKSGTRAELGERIRTILDCPQQFNRMHPYEGRQRKLSGGSTCSSDYSQLSPDSVSSSAVAFSPFVSHPAIRSSRDLLVFEKLRHVVPQLSSEENPLQALVDIVTQAMDLDSPSPTISPKHSSASLNSFYEPFPVPEDLQNVDVTAFKHLIYSQPILFDSRLFM